MLFFVVVVVKVLFEESLGFLFIKFWFIFDIFNILLGEIFKVDLYFVK